MGFSKKSANDSDQNKLVSLFTEPYCWNSTQGPVINNPLKMDDYPMLYQYRKSHNFRKSHNLFFSKLYS